MNRFEETPQVFSCEGCSLIGMLHKPVTYQKRAVLIVVGGPQTRVGSHRQFVLLARHLAAQGIAVLRFDYRGMGDSEGPARGFENNFEDISTAIDLLWSELPGVEEVVLWGLCDAASAAMMYASEDERVAGIVLLNPWARTEMGEARAFLEHYYVSHIFSVGFWKRLLSGKVNVIDSIGSLLSFSGKAFSTRDDSAETDGFSEKQFQDRMLEGLEAFSGPVLLIMSGDDLTAAEFSDLVSTSRRWKRALSADLVTRRDSPDANHTFSRQMWRDQVADWCEAWVQSW